MRRPASASAELPKGMASETLDLVAEALRRHGQDASASLIADAIGTSRVTARRYLEHLAHLGVVRRDVRHGGPGRPEVVYSWPAGGSG